MRPVPVIGHDNHLRMSFPMPVNLNYTDFAPMRPYGLPIVIVHGLFGSSSNWGSIAKELMDAHTYRVIDIDLRNHGGSPHADSMSYAEMAEDIKQLMDTLSIDKASFMGHSMGGKVMMTFAHMFPEYIKHLIVVDIAPVTYDIDHTPQINAMLQLDLGKVSNRQDADNALAKDIPEEGVRQFLLQNLKSQDEQQDGKYQWRLNLSVIKDSLDEISSFPTDIDTTNIAYPVLFIGGEESEYFQKEHVSAAVASYPSAQIVVMPRASHWVHVEKADQFINLIADYVSRA
ncbi:MAG: alpha/beta fold hydrolase [Gammaproteobacteria bacterium]|nr:alpha/beta fold hydrolase [Gammaproteobacteria bacterium]